MDNKERIKLYDGKFVCSECENEDAPLTSSADGMVPADLEQIKADLTEFPTKKIYAVCPVCGMEYIFVLNESELELEPSFEEK